MPPKSSKTPAKKKESSPERDPVVERAARVERRSAAGSVEGPPKQEPKGAHEPEQVRRKTEETRALTEALEAESKVMVEEIPMDQSQAGPSTARAPSAPRPVQAELIEAARAERLKIEQKMKQLKEAIAAKEQLKAEAQPSREGRAQDFAAFAGPPPKPLSQGNTPLDPAPVTTQAQQEVKAQSKTPTDPVPSVHPAPQAQQQEQAPEGDANPSMGDVLLTAQALGLENPKMSDMGELSKIVQAMGKLGLKGSRAASAAASLAGSNRSHRTQSTTLTRMTKAVHDTVGSVIQGGQGVPPPVARVQEYVDAAHEAAQSESKFVSAADNFMQTPMAHAPQHTTAVQALQALPAAQAVQVNPHQQEQAEDAMIAPIVLMNPDQVLSLTREQIAVAQTPAKIRRQSQQLPIVKETQAKLTPAQATAAMEQGTLPLNTASTVVAMQGNLPYPSVVMPGFKLVPIDPYEAKLAKFLEKKSQKIKQIRFDPGQMPVISSQVGIAPWVKYWRGCTIFCTKYQWHLALDLDNQFSAIMHAMSKDEVLNSFKDQKHIDAVVELCPEAKSRLERWGAYKSSADTGAYFQSQVGHMIKDEENWESHLDGPDLPSTLLPSTATADPEQSAIKSMVQSWIVPDEAPTKKAKRRLDLIWATNEVLATRYCVPTASELKVWSSMRMGQSNVFHPDVAKFESPTEYLNRVLETYALNNRYNKKQFSSDAGRASTLEVFINGLPEHLAKVGHEKRRTLSADASDVDSLSTVAQAVDMHFTHLMHETNTKIAREAALKMSAEPHYTGQTKTETP